MKNRAKTWEHILFTLLHCHNALDGSAQPSLARKCHLNHPHAPDRECTCEQRNSAAAQPREFGRCKTSGHTMTSQIPDIVVCLLRHHHVACLLFFTPFLRATSKRIFALLSQKTTVYAAKETGMLDWRSWLLISQILSYCACHDLLRDILKISQDHPWKRQNSFQNSEL